MRGRNLRRQPNLPQSPLTKPSPLRGAGAELLRCFARQRADPARAGIASLYAISNVQELGEEEFMRRLEAALRNGLQLVQLREKNYFARGAAGTGAEGVAADAATRCAPADQCRYRSGAGDRRGRRAA